MSKNLGAIQSGDVVIADASEDYKDVGKVIEIISVRPKSLVSGLHTYIARPIVDTLSLGFSGYLFRSRQARLAIMKIAQGVSVLGISKGNLEKLTMRFPDQDEQKKIGGFLGSIDQKIQKISRKKELLEEYKKGMMQKLFSQEICFKDELGNDFPEWKLFSVGEILTRVSKPVNVELDQSYRQIGVRSHGKGVFHKSPVSGKELGNKRVFWVVEDALVINIVFAWEHAVALTSVYERGMIASHRFPMYKAQEQLLDINYLAIFFLTSYGKHLLGLASPGGAGRNKTLGQKTFEELKVLIPSKQEQHVIADFLIALDQKIEAVGTKLEQVKEFRKGLLQKMFV